MKKIASFQHNSEVISLKISACGGLFCFRGLGSRFIVTIPIGAMVLPRRRTRFGFVVLRIAHDMSVTCENNCHVQQRSGCAKFLRIADDASTIWENVFIAGVSKLFRE